MLHNTMINANMRMLYLTVAILSVIQIHSAAGCTITSVTSPTASSLNIIWDPFPSAVVYRLELTVINSTSIAPVIVNNIPTTNKLVQGLRPGRNYEITLKALHFWSVELSACNYTSMTVPSTVQIISAEAASSSAISLTWANVTGASEYTVHVEQLFSTNKYSQTFTTVSGEVTGLTESTSYTCYVIASNSAGNGAKGSTRSILTLVPPPPDVNVTSTGKSTATVTWTARSGVLQYEVTVTDTDPSNPPVVHRTQDTYLDINGLEPCSNYTVGVSSLNSFLTPGEPNEVSHVTSNINPVTTVSEEYNCTTATVTITWGHVFGANSYVATVTDAIGESLNCTSQSTSCSISTLKCGEEYTIHVTVISDDCSSTSSISKTFDTVPCAPANPTINYMCSNAIAFEWEHTNHTIFYIAKSIDTNNNTRECRTKGNVCYFTDVACGQTYTFTVQSVSTECDSAISAQYVTQTTPCIPTNIVTSSSCTSNNLTTSWNVEPGAKNYTVSVLGNVGLNYTCTTEGNSCEVVGVECGEHVSVWITATNEVCTTPPQLGSVGATAPCHPTNVSASSGCSPDNATVRWVESKGVVFYKALAVDSRGREYTCFSLDPQCTIKNLSCGETYTATVIGTNFECDSLDNENVTFTTAPCPPANVTADRDCNNNQLTISWDHQSTGLYTAVLEDSQSGDRLNCTTNTADSCVVASPPCGKTYTVTVSYDDALCPSTSAPTTVDSVPCSAENVVANVTCTTGELRVYWSIPVPATDYMTVITGGTPTQTVLCNSTQTQCNQTGLDCGSSYTVTVHSVQGSCLSLPSDQISVETSPCPPTMVTVQKACSPSPSSVSWMASDGATNYIADAVAADGSTSTCESNQTSCSFSDLQCGKVYTVTVSGMSAICQGPPSSNTTLSTEPCSPVNVTSLLDCQARTAEVSWAPSAHAENYSVSATSTGSPVYCHGPGTSCTLTNLDCDKEHVVTVTASDEMCTSAPSQPFTQDPVPCAPQNVQTSLTCSTNDILVTWDAVAVNWDYNVTAASTTGQSPDVTFTSTSNSSSIPGLQCGQNYSITVVAFSGTCVGPVSSPVIQSTAPCGPNILSSDITCGSNMLDVTLSAAPGASSYTVTVSGPNSFSSDCTGTSLTCQITGLQCATEYSVSAVAGDGHCNSFPTQTNVTTGPCDTATVTSSLVCNSDSADVSWEAASGAITYTVTASEVGALHETSCTSNTLSCQLQQLNCGQSYTLTVVSEGSTCNSTGTTASLLTVPCVPTIQSYSLVCGTDTSTLTWSSEANVETYSVLATPTNGQSVSCTSETVGCTLTDLQCSETYTATVIANGIECSSDPSSDFSIITVPCAPPITSTQYTCSSSSVTITWTEPAGNTGFYAQIVGDHTDSCDTTSTSCDFHNIPCGSSLVINVKAKGPECDSEDSVSDPFDSEPCVPVGLTVAAYTVGVAQVQWSAAQGAASYSVEAEADPSISVSTTSTSPQAELTGLLCDKTYNISTTANNGACDPGATSQQIQLKTEPCPPTNIQANVQCGLHIATVSWDFSENAEGYVAFLQNQQSHDIFCEATNIQSSCTATGLQCGTVYSVWAIAVGNPYNSSSSNAINVTAEPCIPSNINVSVDCEAKIATVSWQPSEGAQSYVTELTSSDHTDICSNTSSSCQPSHLHCGEQYTVSVTAVGANCNSTGHMAENFYTEPCDVTGVTVDYTVGSALVQWNTTQGATSYSVEAVTDQGTRSECNSSSTTECTVSGLQCSELYNITVSAHNQACDSQGVESDTVHLTTEPCPPTNIQYTVTCGQLEVTISWDQSDFAVGYTAYVNSTQGNSAWCEAASSGTSCVVSDLDCGSVYNAWVIAKGVQYNSSESSVITFTSEPCLPPSIDALVDCNSDGGGTVSWTASAGNNYTVSTDTGGNPQILCTTQQNSCVVSGLSCGQSYSLSINVTNVECTLTAPAQGSLSTRPCAPMGISTTRDCFSGNVTVSWQPSAGADEYTANVTSASEQSQCSSPSAPTCSVNGLRCGQNFSVSVTASSAHCTVTSSELVYQATAPCIPTNVDAVMNCTSDTATVSWDASDGADEYTVTGQNGQNSVSCGSPGLSCNIINVACSTQYSFQVVANDSECSSAPSQAVTLTTAPCPPENVTANIDCATNDLTVSWASSAHADHYLVSVSAQDGGSDESCNITNSPCTLSSVSCGNTFVTSVTAARGSCRSHASLNTSVVSAPCQPQIVAGIIDCVRNSARVSWTSAMGANSYIVHALGERDLRSNCTTSTNTTCETELECATHYNFTVIATNGQCESPESAHIELETAPCSLTGIRANTQCHNSTIHVEWDVAEGRTGDTVYIATAEDSNNNNISCNSTGNSCYLQNALCGLRYTIMVSATSDICNDLRSPPYHITTEPCQPNTPAVVESCGDAFVSWTLSPIAEMYHVYVVGEDGHQHICNTTFNNCTLAPLHCDQHYSAYVIASHENCSSVASPNTTFYTGPCKPDNLLVTYDCENSSALLTWDESSNAISYHASAVDQNGGVLYCCSNTSSCNFEGLQCGSKYNFTVMATDGTCNSSYSDPTGPIGAVPCPPGNVAVKLLPVQNDTQIVSVSWLTGDCINEEYFVTLNGNIFGNSTFQFDVSSYWTTKDFFELPLPCGSDFNATVEARNSAGQSNPSAAISGSTGGCAIVLSTRLT